MGEQQREFAEDKCFAQCTDVMLGGHKTTFKFNKLIEDLEASVALGGHQKKDCKTDCMDDYCTSSLSSDSHDDCKEDCSDCCSDGDDCDSKSFDRKYTEGTTHSSSSKSTTHSSSKSSKSSKSSSNLVKDFKASVALRGHN